MLALRQDSKAASIRIAPIDRSVRSIMSGRELFSNRLADSHQGFFRPSQAPIAPTDNSPVALKASSAERKSDERLVGEFLSRNPRRQNSHAHTALDHFFDGIHISQFDDHIQHNFFPAKIVLDRTEGITVPLRPPPSSIRSWPSPPSR